MLRPPGQQQLHHGQVRGRVEAVMVAERPAPLQARTQWRVAHGLAIAAPPDVPQPRTPITPMPRRQGNPS